MSSIRTAMMPKIDNHPVILTTTRTSIQHRLIMSMRTGGQVPPILEVGRSVPNPQLTPGLVDDMIASMWINLCQEYIRHFAPRIPEGLIDWSDATDAV